MSADVPVIPGFYPDPSLCRVGDTYYLANSSFEYRPGVPIHASEDLVSWRLVANALAEPRQFPDSAGTGSSGIFAPTLRHHDGLFWLVTTDVAAGLSEQSIQHASEITGPWSTPVRTAGAVGIDPDLAWDGETCYLTWAAFEATGSRIMQAEIDPFTGALAEEPRHLWEGTGLSFPEGPHVFARGDHWYLLIAEGGTERGHCASIARGPSPRGPFTGAPGNPLLSHRSLPSPVQNTGHADLVERPDGSWAMVYLGVRPRGTSPGFHVNGRETFLAGVDWVDEWPVVDERRFEPRVADHSFVEEFVGDELDGRWISPGVFPLAFATPGAPGLRLEAGEKRFLGVRVRDEAWEVEVEVAAGSRGFSLELRMDEGNSLAVEVTDGRAVGVAQLAGRRWELASVPIPAESVHRLRLTAVPLPASMTARTGPDRLELAVAAAGAWMPVGELDGRYLSTEVAGGFTGRVVGVAVADGAATVHSFAYEAHTG